MSSQGHKSHSPASRAHRESRRTVSTYDKMQEARSRRAALLNEDETETPPDRVEEQPKAPAPPPEPREPRAAVPPPAEPSVAPSRARRPGRRVGWVILFLTLLLAALVTAALLRLDRTPPPVPEATSFSDDLGQQGVGIPLLVALTRNIDARPVRVSLKNLPRPAPDAPPTSLAAPAPFTEAPLLLDRIDNLTPPPARPASLTIASDRVDN